MRWADDGSEVSLLGVGYYAPFYVEYEALKRLGVDIRRVIDDDVEHLRRMGAGCVRIHVFDVECSDSDGALVDNEHLDLLDYLVDRCAHAGIYSVLTPIAWWNSKQGNGFSTGRTMQQMTGDADALALQCRFLREFAEHVNRYSGLRYADDPAVICFETINEPHYRKDMSAAEITAYVNALYDASRLSGTTKPIFHSAWLGTEDAVLASKVEGVTGSSYPAGPSLKRTKDWPLLGMLPHATLGSEKARAARDRVKMVYEFDGIGTLDSYLFPAMAKSWRADGVQIASQFQYDSLPTAAANDAWSAHYFSLVYTPKRALSFEIAAAVLRNTPRYEPYVRSVDRMSFGNVSLDANADWCVWDDGVSHISSGNVPLSAKAHETYRHVHGCGVTELVATSGNGAYYLDRVAAGVWRLQLYPNVYELADPFSGCAGIKRSVTPDPVALTVKLPDLGKAFRACGTLGYGYTNAYVASACEGKILLSPGDWTLFRSGIDTMSACAVAAKLDVPRYVAPRPNEPFVRSRFRPAPSALSIAAKIATCGSFMDYQFFDVKKLSGWMPKDPSRIRDLTVRDDVGNMAYRIGRREFRTQRVVSCVWPVEAREVGRAFPKLSSAKKVVFKVRACEPSTKSIEFQIFAEGFCWKSVRPVSTQWSEVAFPLAGPFDKTDAPSGMLPAVADIDRVGICFGSWLFPESVDESHSCEISGLRFE